MENKNGLTGISWEKTLPGSTWTSIQWGPEIRLLKIQKLEFRTLWRSDFKALVSTIENPDHLKSEKLSPDFNMSGLKIINPDHPEHLIKNSLLDQ